MELGGQLLRLFSSQVEATYINHVVKFYKEILARGKQSASQNEVIYAVCLYAELIEFCSPAMLTQGYPEVLSQFQGLFVQWPIADVRQTLVYTYGVMAERVMVKDDLAIQQTDQFLQECDPESQIESYETALVALFKMSLFYKDAPAEFVSKGMGAFQNNLPLKTQGEEAISAHALFVKQVQANHPSIDMTQAKKTLSTLHSNSTNFIQKRIINQETLLAIESLF